jgi:hypothetical protein
MQTSKITWEQSTTELPQAWLFHWQQQAWFKGYQLVFSWQGGGDALLLSRLQALIADRNIWNEEGELNPRSELLLGRGLGMEYGLSGQLSAGEDFGLAWATRTFGPLVAFGEWPETHGVMVVTEVDVEQELVTMIEPCSGETRQETLSWFNEGRGTRLHQAGCIHHWRALTLSPTIPGTNLVA